jgi:hypothetical protein
MQTVKKILEIDFTQTWINVRVENNMDIKRIFSAPLCCVIRNFKVFIPTRVSPDVLRI